MKRLPILVVTLLVVVAAIAVGVVLANRDDNTRAGMGPGVTRSSSTPGWWTTRGLDEI